MTRGTTADGSRTLALEDGTAGRLVPAPPWSWRVHDLTGPSPEQWLQAAEEWAAEEGVLDLRGQADLPGAQPLGGGQAVRPVLLDLPDAAATRALGARVAGALRAGDLLVLSGPLGAGKTTFTQGLGEALGVRGRVTSPTFVLARVHRGPLPLVHVDAYRLREPGNDRLDLDDLDLDAALEDAVTVVEWGDGLVEHLSQDRLEVRLGRVEQPDDRRTARLVAHGRRWLG
jgi:tRNA threonylcarbamoyladenosine biosynthesis protein TsaE